MSVSIPPPTAGTEWEYTQNPCDVFELHHMCNYMAGHGWEPVFAVESHEGVQLPEHIDREMGTLRKGRPLRPYTILFRRPIPLDEEAGP